MMVVNANFDPGLFYLQNITGLCDDVLYEFSADIFNLNAAWATDRIKGNVSFLINGVEVYNTGDIPRNEKWNTYGFTFSTLPNQTSVVLSLRNNAPGGIGNDLALDNITFRPCGSQALILPQNIANICEDGDPIELQATVVGSAFETTFIQWQQSFNEGQNWVDLPGETNTTYIFNNLNSGKYYYRFLLADTEDKLRNARCRTFSNTKIINVIPELNTASDSICVGRSVLFGERNLFTTGTYIDTLQNIVGCDSIVTYHLTMVDNNLRADFSIENPSCSYLTDGSIALESLTSSGPYDVRINFQPSQPPWSLQQLDSGDYRFSILDRYKCLYDTAISLELPESFEVNLGPNQNLLLGEKFETPVIVTDEVLSYEWVPRQIDCQPPCDLVSTLFLEDSKISVTATSLKGCKASDEVNVTIEEVLDAFIPNVFTPNNDKVNDHFTIYNQENINVVDRIIELSIYSRSGKKIFSTSDISPDVPELGWDGKMESDLLPSGIYYYDTTLKFINGKTLKYTGYLSMLY